jgi:hypothetical protein
MIEWLRPEDCAPPHRVTCDRHAQALTRSLATDGWMIGKPALLGYTGGPHDGPRVQLISGSHRWAAASALGMLIPVYVMTYEQVFDMCGTDAWVHALAHPPLVL